MPICFDLDGTLGHFGGGYTLLREALGELWGGEPGSEELRRCAGSTDWEIVEELHRNRFGRDLEEAHYLEFQEACLSRFEGAFPPGASGHAVFTGPLGALRGLRARGFSVAIVSGNAPRLLDFKLERLGVPPEVPRIGSLPRLSRSALLLRMVAGCRGPHAYLGDRPHDAEAAQAAGIPFVGVGDRVPGDHPVLPEAADPEAFLQVLAPGLSGLRIRQ
ncbi:MAG: HAD family hydrolase [Acidobacteria bacterium]|nr:HAD family hydrolase [Acidobacteriota bacterium]